MKKTKIGIIGMGVVGKAIHYHYIRKISKIWIYANPKRQRVSSRSPKIEKKVSTPDPSTQGATSQGGRRPREHAVLR